MRTTVLIVGLTAYVAAGVYGLNQLGYGIGVAHAAGAKSDGAPDQRTWTVPTARAPRVRVENIAGSIAVEPAARNEVAIKARKRGGSAADRARWTVTVEGGGDEVRARVCCGPCESPQRDCPSAVAVDFALTVPRASQLTLNAVSSSIAVRGVSGAQHLHSVSGEVRVKDAGEVAVNTVSGHVAVTHAATLALHSVSSDASVEGVPGETQARSVSGNLAWAGTCGRGCRIHFHSTSGNARLALAPASSFELEYRSMSGELSNRLGAGLTSTEMSRGRVRARYGSGGGAITCKTLSGDLELRPR